LYLHNKEESLAQLETQDLVRDARLLHGWVWQLLVQLLSLMLAGHQDCLTYQVQQSWAGSHHMIPAVSCWHPQRQAPGKLPLQNGCMHQAGACCMLDSHVAYFGLTAYVWPEHTQNLQQIVRA